MNSIAPAFETLPEALRFLRARFPVVIFVSALLLIPCLWHDHVVACDLPSHTYNAWLASLISSGQAPSLYFAPQWNNVLFDILLSRGVALFGFALGEKIVVSLTVLLFFWGAFAVAAAASRRAPWFLAPLIAMVAYGWTFAIGFSNYYLSVALAFWGIALLWHAPPRLFVVAIPLAAIAYFAHPIGAAWFLGAIAYVRLCRVLSGWARLIPCVLGIALVFAVRAYLQSHYPVILGSHELLMNGVDQLLLGLRFMVLVKLVLVFGLACIALDLFVRRNEAGRWRELAIPAGLYLISLAAVQFLPDAIMLPQYPAPLTFISTRLTLIAAIAAIGVLATMTPRVWHLLGFAAAAGFFFAFLWQETEPLAKLERQADELVAQLPPGQRVIGMIHPFAGSRFHYVGHLVERACIGKCFSWANYEPSSGQFRVRALAGSPLVASREDVVRIAAGTYVVRESDLPLYQIEQCSPDLTRLCLRALQAGETNLPKQEAPPPAPANGSRP